MYVVGVVGISTAVLIGAMAVPAGAGGFVPGSAPLTIEKDVDGPVPEDTEFTVTIECNDAIISTGSGSPPASSAEVDFDDEGDPDGSNVITFVLPGTCTVTETEDGDADDVSYECEGSFNIVSTTTLAGGPCGASGPREDPITVSIVVASQSATVTVDNEFPDPEPEPVTPAAQALEVTPTFTG
jgi:hypothetical protein